MKTIALVLVLLIAAWLVSWLALWFVERHARPRI
jgi:hypothetical protein